MRGRRPQPLTGPDGIPAPNVLAFEGTDRVPIKLCNPAGGRLLSPSDVCHSAFAWWIGASVGMAVGWRALWRTLRGGGCATGEGSLLLCWAPVRLFLAAFDQAQTVAIYVLPAATGSL